MLLWRGMAAWADFPCPTNDAQPFAVVQMVRESSGAMTLSWESCPTNYWYVVQSSGSLTGGGWTNRWMTMGAEGATGWTEEETTEAETSRFYRVVRLVGSEDSDGDGMSNGWEGLYWPTLDPWVDDSLQDPDGDGLSNLEEYQRGSDPTVYDASAPGGVVGTVRFYYDVDGRWTDGYYGTAAAVKNGYSSGHNLVREESRGH